MKNPLIACLCPTYKRPELLRNSIACFVAQTYPNRVLVILDDAGQHAAQDCPAERWRLMSQSDRYPNLPAKLNALAAMVPEADILAVWEDDDIYLPHHLAAIAEAASGCDEAAFFAPDRVLSTYRMPRGRTQEENAMGRFHASWAYTRRLWDSLGGYEAGDRLDFDQRMGARCRASAGFTCYDQTDAIRRFGPSYAYRWGSGPYNGSQAGEEGYASLWRQLDEVPSGPVESTGPRMDEETRLIHALHGWGAPCDRSGAEPAESRSGYSAPGRALRSEGISMASDKSIESPGKRTHRKNSIGLVMLVKDDGAIIERCLASVRDVIDTWLIVDIGSTDDTAGKVQAMLNGIPGEYLSRPWRDDATHRHQLLELSRHRAEYGLWMEVDETLACNRNVFEDRLTASAYCIEIRTSRGSWMRPRLLHRDAEVRFVGTVAEALVGIGQTMPLDDVVIRHHDDGVRRREAAGNTRDILHLEYALLDEPADRESTLALAEAYAARGEHVAALRHYRRRAELGGDAPQVWYALYQAARMLDEHGFATPLVVEAYFAAYDFRPTKAEPLVRIARRCLQEGRNDTAADIARAAISTPFEDREYFFEPGVYRGESELMYVRALLALGRHADVVAHAEQLIAVDRALLPAIQQEIDDLRNVALQRQADGSSGAAPPDLRGATQSEAPRPRLPATPRRAKRKLCIGMATYDDYDGVYFSVQAIRVFHPEIADQVELLVIDNNPTGRCAEGLKNLDAWVPNYRYVPESEMRGTAARDLIFREAAADYVLVMDCHVLIVPGALQRLLDYFDGNPDCADLLQGPLLYDDLSNLSTHFEPVWRQGMYGIWATDPRGMDPEAPPFEIPMQGLGVFACRKDAWPGFNPRFRGFGGEEGYIHEKFRQAGAKALCLPFLRWIHRFHRPMGIPYAANWYQRVRNYSIGHQELGLDRAPIEAHFNDLLGEPETAAYKARINHEIGSPLYMFDGVYAARQHGPALGNLSENREAFERLGIGDRVIATESASIDSGDDDDAHALERVLAHREIIERAKRQGLRSVLIIESANGLERALLADGHDVLKALCSDAWGVFLFTAPPSESGFPGYCAAAYHESVYDHVLEQIPEQPELARQWMVDVPGSFGHLKVDRILARHQKNVTTVGDINQHLETIKSYAGRSSHVTEMGVRGVVSTWSLLAGKPGKAVSYDTYRSPCIDEVEAIAKEHGIAFEFIQKNVLEVEIDPTDLLFIDTLHTYEQLRSELGRHGNKSRKYIILHDTATFADVGENGLQPGLRAAIDEFLERNRHWQVAEHFSHNNGLTCLVRRSDAFSNRLPR
ncbi:MAG: glycosyltransferase [Betaproteobacteria bacterium]